MRHKDAGVVIAFTRPPYSERMFTLNEARALYSTMHHVFFWSYCARAVSHTQLDCCDVQQPRHQGIQLKALPVLTR